MYTVYTESGQESQIVSLSVMRTYLKDVQLTDLRFINLGRSAMIMYHHLVIMIMIFLMILVTIRRSNAIISE